MDGRKLSNEEIDQALGVVQIALGLLIVQVRLSDEEPSKIGHDPWALGYTAGVFRSALRSCRVPQGPNELALIAIGYEQLFGSAEEASSALRLCALLGSDVEFAAGKSTGASELSEFLLREGGHPEGLRMHLTRVTS